VENGITDGIASSILYLSPEGPPQGRRRTSPLVRQKQPGGALKGAGKGGKGKPDGRTFRKGTSGMDAAKKIAAGPTHAAGAAERGASDRNWLEPCNENSPPSEGGRFQNKIGPRGAHITWPFEIYAKKATPPPLEQDAAPRGRGGTKEKAGVPGGINLSNSFRKRNGRRGRPAKRKGAQSPKGTRVEKPLHDALLSAPGVRQGSNGGRWKMQKPGALTAVSRTVICSGPPRG